MGVGLNGIEVTGFAANGTKFYAGTGNGVYLSLDSGATWNVLKNNSSSPGAVATIAVDGNGNIFAGTGVGVYLSSDNGEIWNVINKGLTQAAQAPSVGSLVVNANDYLFAATRDSGVFRSVNPTQNGYTIQNFWEFLNGPYCNCMADSFPNNPDDTTKIQDSVPFNVTNIVIAPDNSIVVSVDGNNSQNGMFGILRSTDNGTTWNWTYNTGVNFLAVGPNGDIYAGGNGYLCSKDTVKRGIP